MIRYNTLKIFISAMDAKPGGQIGAMLAPYLFSTNMSLFCKKFNELTVDFESNFWLAVTLYCDILEKTFTFNVKTCSIVLFILDEFFLNGKLSIRFFFDLSKYFRLIYKCTVYQSLISLFAIIRSFKKRRKKIFIFKKFLFSKLFNFIKINGF